VLPEASARLWAKRREEDGRIHPLAYHLLDVAHVAQALSDSALAAGLRAHFVRSPPSCPQTMVTRCLALPGHAEVRKP